MASLITYILLANIAILTVSESILNNPVSLHSKRSDCLCRKLNDMIQNNFTGSFVRHAASKKSLRALHQAGCKIITKNVSTPIPEKRGRSAASLDLLDIVIKPIQTKPIYAPSVLIPKKARNSAKFRFWDKMRFFGK